jgi:hypothetical protein
METEPQKPEPSDELADEELDVATGGSGDGGDGVIIVQAVPGLR